MATSRICSVNGCGKLHAAKGYCFNHWRSFTLYGDPLARAVRRKGKVQTWLDDVAVPYSGDECLIFPFYRMKSGHGHISRSLGADTAHLYVGQKALGPKPAPNYEICHDCGNGGCVNPKHLYWGTRTQNMNDRWRHGVMTLPPVMRGSDNAKAILTPDMVRLIRERFKAGATTRTIAEELGVGKSTINNVKYRTAWAWLT